MDVRTENAAVWEAMTIRAKLEHYVSTEPLDIENPNDVAARNDFWADVLGLPSGGYNGHVDQDIIDVMQKMADQEFFAQNTHEELIAYILCSAELAEYGTSPRGAWIRHDIKDLVPSVIKRWQMDK